MTTLYTRNEKVTPILTFFYQFAYGGYITFFARFLTHLGFAPSTISYIAVLFPLALVIFGPIWGRASDKRGERKSLLSTGTLLTAIIFFAMTLITTDNSYLVIPLFFGYGAVSISNATLSIAIFADENQGDPKKLAILNSVTSAGNAAGAFCFGFLLQTFSLQLFGAWCGILTFLSFCFSRFLAQKKSEPTKVVNLNPKQKMPKKFVVLLVSIFFRYVGIFAVFSVSSNIMAIRGLDEIQIGFLLGLNTFCQIFLMLLAGRLLRKIPFKPMYMIGAALSALSLFIFSYAFDFWTFVASQVVLALSYAALYSALLYYIEATTTKANRGQYTGFMNSASYLGHVAGNALFATLLLGFTTYELPILIVAFMPLITFSIVTQQKFNLIPVSNNKEMSKDAGTN